MWELLGWWDLVCHGSLWAFLAFRSCKLAPSCILLSLGFRSEQMRNLQTFQELSSDTVGDNSHAHVPEEVPARSILFACCLNKSIKDAVLF